MSGTAEAEHDALMAALRYGTAEGAKGMDEALASLKASLKLLAARARREGRQEAHGGSHKALAACLIALLKRQGETRLHLTGDEVEAAYKHLDTERSFELTWNRVTDDVFFEFFPLPTEAQA
jgi:hypothetical protein